MKSYYDDYYLHQSGGGVGPIFYGKRFQTGSGLGAVFSSLARSVIPILKSGGKTLLKEGLRSGLDVLGDVVSGSDINSSVKRRARQSGQRLLTQAANVIDKPAPPGLPKTSLKKTNRKKVPKRKKNSSIKKDIFR